MTESRKVKWCWTFNPDSDAFGTGVKFGNGAEDGRLFAKNVFPTSWPLLIVLETN